MRASDGSAMRKWMGFHKGESTRRKNCPTRDYADFSLCLLETQIFFPDSHAMRTTCSVRCHASRVENWSLIYSII